MSTLGLLLLAVALLLTLLAVLTTYRMVSVRPIKLESTLEPLVAENLKLERQISKLTAQLVARDFENQLLQKRNQELENLLEIQFKNQANYTLLK